MSELDGNKGTSQAPAPLAAELSAIRGLARRLPDGSPKQIHHSVLARTLTEETASPFCLQRHVQVMTGTARRVPVEDSALIDHAPEKAAAWLKAQGE